MTPRDPIVDEQIRYYRARAPVYDDWFLRRGPFDHGEEENARWFSEVEEVRGALRNEQATGTSVLELACGTGHWTAELSRRATRVLALDASPEVLEINRERVGEAAAEVRYQRADLFEWQPSERYDFVFFGFWLSHIPAAEFDGFWRKLARCLAPGGCFFFVDNLAPSDSEQRTGEERIQRRIPDGRTFEIVKSYFEPGGLEARLASLGFTARVRSTNRFFLVGSGQLGSELELASGSNAEGL